MPTSSQLRNALAYMSITVLVLVFLNIYSARATRDLMFKAKCSSSQDKLKVVTSSFSGVDALTQETTEQIISVIGDMNVTRLLVTDAAGRTLYDSVPGQSAAGKVVLLQQVVQALEGNDVFCCVYEDHTLKSYAAAPILTHDTVVGCVYMMEYDASQGGIIASLERTIFRGSLVLIGILFLCAVVFSMTGSGRMRQILTSMRLVREGEYSHKIQMRGSDEYATLATEFNKLTDKLQQTEITERQFVSDASHELKTPITSIRVLADSLMGMEEVPVELYKEFMADISDEIDRETKIINDLLTLVKSDKATTKLNISQVSINNLLEQILKRLRPIAKKQNIELVLENIREVTADVDETKLSLALSNLVENAIKYNREEGWVRVVLDADHKFFYVKVIDNGIGIPEELHERVFERFYRVDKARSRETGGTGLGLSITKSIVQMHNGALKLQSKEDEGTTFTVRIPLNYIS